MSGNGSDDYFPPVEKAATSAQPPHPQTGANGAQADASARRRSASAPQRRPPLRVLLKPQGNDAGAGAAGGHGGNGTATRGTTVILRARNRNRDIHPEMADMLDVIDPEVSTLNSVTNIQNSLFVPSLGRFLNRQPTYELTRLYEDAVSTKDGKTRGPEKGVQQSHDEDSFEYATVPEGVSLHGWSDEEKDELNDYVRHMLHSRRSKFKRSIKAFGQYIRKPLGFLVTLYATLITLFGLAWVLFLIGWIYVGDRQLYVINVIDYVLVALFAIVGDGMIPFRTVDTYHMIYIARYQQRNEEMRRRYKQNEPGYVPSSDPDVEAARHETGMYLTPPQQVKLWQHQQKLAKSHTFYKPHETKTHHPFPLPLLVVIVVLLDLHSCLQVSLGATTYGMDWRTRPAAITASILSCSIAVNITAGVLINVGGRKTRKKEVVERMFREELTLEALDKMRHEGKKHGDATKQYKAERALEQGRNSDEDSEELELPSVRG